MWTLIREIISKIVFFTGLVVWGFIVFRLSQMGWDFIVAPWERKKFLEEYPDYPAQQKEIERKVREFKGGRAKMKKILVFVCLLSLLGFSGGAMAELDATVYTLTVTDPVADDVGETIRKYVEMNNVSCGIDTGPYIGIQCAPGDRSTGCVPNEIWKCSDNTIFKVWYSLPEKIRDFSYEELEQIISRIADEWQNDKRLDERFRQAGLQALIEVVQEIRKRIY